jgi:hypothetical protein
MASLDSMKSASLPYNLISYPLQLRLLDRDRSQPPGFVSPT